MSDHDKMNNSDQSTCLHIKGCDFMSIPNRTNNEPEHLNNHKVHYYYCNKCEIQQYLCLKCNRHNKRKCEFNRISCTDGTKAHTHKQQKRNKYVHSHQLPSDNCNNAVNSHVQLEYDGDNSFECNNDTTWLSDSCNKQDVDSHVQLESDGDNSIACNNDTYIIQNEKNDDTDSVTVADQILECDWGNVSSRIFFFDEHKKTHNGLHSIVDRATKRPQKDIESMLRDTDYHVLSACLFKGLTRQQTQMLITFIKETIRREKDEDINTEELSAKFVRRVYTEGPKSIYNTLPVPVAKPGGTEYDNFAIVSVEEAAVHILASGVPLKTLDYNVISHWKNDDGYYHTLFHEELYAKIGKIQNCPKQLRIYQIYIWSDGFQKNTLVKRKATSLQLFTIYFVPPDGTRNIAKYTVPFALGQKQKQHQSLLNLVLKQTAELQKVRSMYCGKTKKIVNVFFELVIIQNDHIERVNNLGVVQAGTYGKRYGHSHEYNSKTIMSCKNCIKSRIQNLYIGASTNTMCSYCSDWWNGIGNNIKGYMEKPDNYPTIEQTHFDEPINGEIVPDPPDGRTITNSDELPPCKLSFSFLIKAFVYAKFQYQHGFWTKENTVTYLRTCCVGGDIIYNLKQNRQQANIPELWLKHEEYGVEIENFPDAPMHMLFLGITKHLLANVVRLFDNSKVHYKEFSKIISMHLECGSKLSIDWCNMSQFSDKEGITTIGWQSDQYLAFARMLLVYFGLLDDYSDVVDRKKIVALQQVFVLWCMLLSALFTNDTCNTRLVDDCVRLFLSACIHYGETTIKKINKGVKKGKNKGEAAFFQDTSNYFSLLNLKQLIERFGSIRELWEGEREKFIKYVKKEMNTICNTEKYMPGVLNRFLCNNKMNDFVRENQLHEELVYSKTRNFRVYKDFTDLNDNFRRGMMLSGVIMKSKDNGKEDIFICYKGHTINALVLHRVEFDDTQHKTKLCLHYAVIKLSNAVGECSFVHFESRDLLMKEISGYVIIHPMVTKDKKFKISNGHTVLTYCWRVRTNEGICDFLPTVSGFVFNN